MDGSEYLKYMTEKVVKYIETPSEAEQTDDAMPGRKISKEPWLTRWFGVAPMGIMMWWGSRADKKNKAHPEVRSANPTSYR